jgi:hypothetical protein
MQHNTSNAIEFMIRDTGAHCSRRGTFGQVYGSVYMPLPFSRLPDKIHAAFIRTVPVPPYSDIDLHDVARAQLPLRGVVVRTAGMRTKGYDRIKSEPLCAPFLRPCMQQPCNGALGNTRLQSALCLPQYVERTPLRTSYFT